MHAIGIIILTPLAIVLGLILLGLVFTPWVWKAIGYLILGVIGLVLIIAIVPKTPTPVAPVARPMQGETMLQSQIDSDNAERNARWAWIKASGVDYPYI